MLRWIQGKTRKDRIRNEKFKSDAMVKPITTCHPETPFVVWPCDEKRRHERCTRNNDEGGSEETSRKAQTEVDGQSVVTVERFETTPARSKARTEPRSMEKGSHGDRPRTGIRSAKPRGMTIRQTNANHHKPPPEFGPIGSENDEKQANHHQNTSKKESSYLPILWVEPGQGSQEYNRSLSFMLSARFF